MKRLLSIGMSALVPACLVFASESADTLSRNLGEVVVTGSNDATARNLLPYTVTTVGATRLEATGDSKLLSAISGLVPSLFVTERNMLGFGLSNGGSGGIKIRGVGGAPTNGVLMMVDGQPQYSGVFSHPVADSYMVANAERVEVLRGPGSVLYGSNAMGGVINVITRDVTKEGISGQLNVSGGSYNTWLTSASMRARYGRWSLTASINYDHTDGLLDNFDFSQLGGYFKGGYKINDNWNLAVDYSVMHFKGNDPVYPTLSDPESTDIYHQNVTRGEASLTAVNRYGRVNGSTRVYYSYGNHYVDDPRHFHSLDDRLGILAYQNVALWHGAVSTIGFDFDRYTGSVPISGDKHHTDGSLSTMERKAITEYSPYLTLCQSLFDESLVLNAGVRVANSSMFDTRVIPQGGIVWHPAVDWTIKGSVARGYRNPSFKELYLYRMANAELQPELMTNYEVTVGTQALPGVGIDITAYYSRGSNMIQVVDMKNVNTGSFINKGIEVSARWHADRRLQFWATYSLLHTSLDDLTAAPRNQYYLGASWNPIDALTVDAELKGVEGLYVADDIDRQSYATLNMRFAWQVCRYLSLSLNLDNVTAARYQINRGYPMPRFTAMGGIKLSF